LAVASELIKKYRHVKFFFIGGTEGKEDVVKRFASNQIVFTGHRTDIPSVLKRMDIFVLPSYSEGLPNALMEAMAVGVVPLSSRVGGATVLIEEGENGLFFTPGDRTDLQEKLTTLIEDPNLRRKLGAAAAGRIADDFDLAKESQKLLTVLRNED